MYSTTKKNEYSKKTVNKIENKIKYTIQTIIQRNWPNFNKYKKEAQTKKYGDFKCTYNHKIKNTFTNYNIYIES